MRTVAVTSATASEPSKLHARALAREGRMLARELRSSGCKSEAALVRALADRVEVLHEARAHAG